MNRRRSTLAALAVLLLLLLVGAAINLRPGGAGPSHAVVSGKGSHQKRGFSVGVVSRHLLYPGQAAPLDLVFANKQAFDVQVVALQVRTDGSTDCPARFYRLGRYELRQPVVVDSHDVATGQVPFALRPSAPDSCQSANVSVDVTATAVKR